MREISKKERRLLEIANYSKKLETEKDSLHKDGIDTTGRIKLYIYGILKFILFLGPMFLIAFWLSKPDSEEKIRDCQTKLKSLHSQYELSELADTYDFSDNNPLVYQTRTKIFNELKTDIASIDRYLKTGVFNSKEYEPKVNFQHGCSLEYFEDEAPKLLEEAKAEQERIKYEALPESEKLELSLSPEERRAKVVAEMQEEYSKIDEQDKENFIKAKKHAVRYYRTVPGPGIEVHSFTFKSGRTVTCTVEVASTGRISQCDGELE